MSARFLSGLRVEEHLDSDGSSVPGQWVLWEPLHYRDAKDYLWIVPRGFITDLASIPRIVRNIIDVNGKHRRAAVIHDYLYVTQVVERDEADALFLEAMESLGVGRATRTTMWLSVRAAGWWYWNRRSGRAVEDDFVRESYFHRRDLI